MYKLLDDTTIVFESESEIVWSEKERGWMCENSIHLDTDKKFKLVITNDVISPIEFKLKFTPQERVAIYASVDSLVKDFVSLLDDTRLQFVDLKLQSTIDAVHYLQSINLLTSNRATEILS